MASNTSATVPLGTVTVPGTGSSVGDKFTGKSIVPGVTEFCTPILGCDVNRGCGIGIPVHVITPVDPPPIAIQRPKLSCIPISPLHCCHIAVGPITCDARYIKPPTRIAPSSGGGSVGIRKTSFFCQYSGGGGAMACDCFPTKGFL